MSKVFEKWADTLAGCPPPGQGVNTWLFGRLRSAAARGVEAAEAVAELPRWMSRAPRTGELARAVRRAYAGTGAQVTLTGEAAREARRRRAAEGRRWDAALRSYIEAGRELGFEEPDLWESSPTRIEWEPGAQDAVAWLRRMFLPEDRVMLLDSIDSSRASFGREVRFRGDWIAELERRGGAGEPLPLYAFANPIAPRPKWGMTGGGNPHPSPRAKGSVAAFRCAVVEHDDLPLAEQFAFWGGWAARHGWGRVRSVTYTGGKSLHVLLSVEGVNSLADWAGWAERGPLAQFARMGFDRAFFNPAQATRLPGAVRPETGRVQKLLFLEVTKDEQ